MKMWENRENGFGRRKIPGSGAFTAFHRNIRIQNHISMYPYACTKNKKKIKKKGISFSLVWFLVGALWPSVTKSKVINFFFLELKRRVVWSPSCLLGHGYMWPWHIVRPNTGLHAWRDHGFLVQGFQLPNPAPLLSNLISMVHAFTGAMNNLVCSS